MPNLKKAYLNFEDSCHQKYIKFAINKKVHRIYENAGIEFKKITEAQRKEIDDFYKTFYGKTVNRKYLEMVYSYNGVFSPRYISPVLYFSEIEFYLNNNFNYSSVFDDKFIQSQIKKSAGINNPKMLFSNVDGLYFDSNYQLLTHDDLLEILKSQKSVFTKKSVGSAGGRSCKMVKFESCNEFELNRFLQFLESSYGTNFVVEEVLATSDALKIINPDSVNTFRIATYLFHGEVHHMPAVLRLGRRGSVVDNASAGGVFVGIKDDGILNDYAFTNAFDKKYNVHPDTGFQFSGHFVPGFPDLLEKVKRMHLLFPSLKIINWDMTLDSNNKPAFIEMNCAYGAGFRLTQIAHGESGFGDDTGEILQWVSLMKKHSKAEREEINKTEGIWLK